MKISIHRPNQIGGQITKISTNQASIIIDLGHNLPNNKGKKDSLDNREAIEALTTGCDAILYTHYHGDHVGLCQHVPSSIPQYISSVSKEVMLCKDKYIMKSQENKKPEYDAVMRMKTYVAGKSMLFGDIKVTPYFVSHSAGYAHMFLIEAEKKKILHTGDFRGHGLLSKGLDKTLKHYIKGVDVLIIEGTMLSRSSEDVLHESKLGQIARRCMADYKYTFVQCSSTDLERLAVISDATKKLGRLLVCDEYQKKVLDIFASIEYKGKKMWNFGDVRVFPSKKERNLDDMISRGFTMFIRSSQINLLKKLFHYLGRKETLFIYSLWDGYIKRQDTLDIKSVKLQDFFKTEKYLTPILYLHTSGHAAPKTLLYVCETLQPTTAIIPIHRDSDTDLRNIGLSEELQDRVVTENCSKNNIDISFCSE